MPRKNSPALKSIGARLDGLAGPKYWRSLDELSRTSEFQEYLHREFPESASEWSASADRRNFLSLMGASLALAGLAGCKPRAEEKIVPYVRQPEQIVPGEPLWYATAMPQNGYAMGVLVESHMGRPTKIEGNPEHPSSLGGTTAQAQASILTMYGPGPLADDQLPTPDSDVGRVSHAPRPATRCIAAASGRRDCGYSQGRLLHRRCSTSLLG